MTSAEGRGLSATAVGEAMEAAAMEAGSAEGSVEEVMEAAATVVVWVVFFCVYLECRNRKTRSRKLKM